MVQMYLETTATLVGSLKKIVNGKIEQILDPMARNFIVFLILKIHVNFYTEENAQSFAHSTANNSYTLAET